MKTYLMKIPEILKGISNTLDITATLCDKVWILFNDEGIRVLFIFERDGTLIVSKNGVVSKQKWSYIKANSTLLIEDAQQAFLLHPVFVDNVIFALKQDGTEHHLFMIDEQQSNVLSLSSLSSLSQYFEQKKVKREKQIEQLELDEAEEEYRKNEEAKANQLRLAEEQRKQKAKKEREEKIEAIVREKFYEKWRKLDVIESVVFWIGFAIAVVVGFVVCIATAPLIEYSISSSLICRVLNGLALCGSGFLSFFLFMMGVEVIILKPRRKNIENEENAMRQKYLND